MEAAIDTAPRPVQAGTASAARTLDYLLRLGPRFVLHDHASARRTALQAYITDSFRRAHGANVSEYLPQLCSLECQGRFSAVAGFRPAQSDGLFVERYLDMPIEEAIRALAGAQVPRDGIIEIGNLAATHRGATLLFFVLIAAILNDAGYRWAVFTATEQIRRILDRLGFAVYDLGSAEAACLGPAAAQWGQYYEARPHTVAANVPATMAVLNGATLPFAALELFSATIEAAACALRARPAR